MHVLITGATGQLGRRLTAALLDRGDRVTALSRDATTAAARLPSHDRLAICVGDPTQPGDWMARLAGCDAIVHLAGASLFERRWSADFKDRLRRSRIDSTQRLVEALGRAEPRPGVLVSGSAIGWYGTSETATFDETSPPAQGGFLEELATQWEQAATVAATSLATRVVLLRTGVVLDPQGGALAQMLPAFRLCAGGPVGSGQQWMSWIHYRDWVGLALLALDRGDLAGPLNATAPQPVRNGEFAKALGRALGRPAILPMPGFALRLMLGEVADVVLTGQRALPRVALAAGYAFAFANLPEALADLVA